MSIVLSFYPQLPSHLNLGLHPILNNVTFVPACDDTSGNSVQTIQTYKKRSIPKKMREMVWNRYIGENVAVAPCWCCQSTMIKNTDFVCGHVVAESCGGDTNVDNLRPICSMCNLSMGTKNMHDFMKLLGKRSTDGDAYWSHLSISGLKIACEFFGRQYKPNDTRETLISHLAGVDPSNFLLQSLERLSPADLSTLSSKTQVSLAKSIADGAPTDIFKYLSINKAQSGAIEVVLADPSVITGTSTAAPTTTHATHTDPDERNNWSRLRIKNLKEACSKFRLSELGTKKDLLQRLTSYNCRHYLYTKTLAQLKAMSRHIKAQDRRTRVTTKREVVSILLQSVS